MQKRRSEINTALEPFSEWGKAAKDRQPPNGTDGQGRISCVFKEGLDIRKLDNGGYFNSAGGVKELVAGQASIF